MSQHTAQSRSFSDKAGRSSAPRGESGAFLEQSGAYCPCHEGLAGLVPAPTPGKEPEKRGRRRAGRCTIGLHRPAAEAGEVIWEMWVNGKSRLT